jgi:hypothetical protein
MLIHRFCAILGVAGAGFWARPMFTQSIVATVVSWLGILGAVLTIFGHLQSAFGLSGWGRWLAAHWQSWMMAMWGDYLGMSHVTWATTGTILVDMPFVTCLTLIAIASRFTPSRDNEVSMRRKLFSLITGAVLLATWYIAIVYLAQQGFDIDIWPAFVVVWFVAFLMVSHWPYRLALLSASAATILNMLLLVAGNGQAEATNIQLAAEAVLMIGVGAVVIFVARPAVFTRQIWFLLFLVAALVAVSELSKLGVSLEPPKA